SRRRHTRCYRDWSSDGCSSDLARSKKPCVAVDCRAAGDPSTPAGHRGKQERGGATPDYKTLHLKMKQYGVDAKRFRELRARTAEIGRATCRERGEGSVQTDGVT